MAKSQASVMVRGLDLGSSFLSALTKRAREAGVPDEAVYEALKPEGRIVAVILEYLTPTFTLIGLASLLDQYEAGDLTSVERRRRGEDFLAALTSFLKQFCQRHRRDHVGMSINGPVDGKDFVFSAGWEDKNTKTEPASMEVLSETVQFQVAVEGMVRQFRVEGREREALGVLAEILQCELSSDPSHIGEDIPYHQSLEMLMRVVVAVIDGTREGVSGDYVCDKLHLGAAMLGGEMARNDPSFARREGGYKVRLGTVNNR